jgi:hypothetical protein
MLSLQQLQKDIDYQQRLAALRLPHQLHQSLSNSFRSLIPLESFHEISSEAFGHDLDRVQAWQRLIVDVLTLDEITIPAKLAATTPVNLPDFEGGSWATEWAYVRSAEQTRKFRFWRRPDPNPLPHNHPWKNPLTGVSFISQIIFGGYTEDVYRFDGTELHCQTTVYRAGDVNVCFYDGFHVVRDIEEGTFTHFITQPIVDGNVWHYLDTETGKLIDPTPIVDFLEQRDRVNPK